MFTYPLQRPFKGCKKSQNLAENEKVKTENGSWKHQNIRTSFWELLHFCLAVPLCTDNSGADSSIQSVLVKQSFTNSSPDLREHLHLWFIIVITLSLKRYFGVFQNFIEPFPKVWKSHFLIFFAFLKEKCNRPIYNFFLPSESLTFASLSPFLSLYLSYTLSSVTRWLDYLFNNMVIFSNDNLPNLI